jgi:DNA-binding XRE family transcriptional regulator
MPIMLASPSPQIIKTTRVTLGYTQKEMAEMLHVSLRAWQLWEAGDRKIPPGLWELCVIKAGLHPLYKAFSPPLTPAATPSPLSSSARSG